MVDKLREIKGSMWSYGIEDIEKEETRCNYTWSMMTYIAG